MSGDIRQALAVRLAAIPEIGIVHTRPRYAKTEAAFRAFYVWAAPDGRALVRGWYVTRTGQARHIQPVGRQPLALDRWSLVGLIGLIDDDASELIASDLADSVVAAIASDQTLGGLVRDCLSGDETGAQIAEIGTVMFAGVLCLRVTISLTTRRYRP